MKRWIVLVLVLWLASVGVIAAFTVRQLYEPEQKSYLRWRVEPDASIDGEAAFMMHAYGDSNVHVDGAPLWRQRQLFMVPAAEIGGSKENILNYWRADAITAPYSLSFEKLDGTFTGPHRVEFPGDPEENSFLMLGWRGAGKSFTLPSHKRGYPEDSRLLDGKFWNRDATQKFIISRLPWVGYAAAAAVVLLVVAGISRFLHSRSVAKATSRIVPPRT